MTKFSTWGELPNTLAHRRWWFSDQPFPHLRATNVFTTDFYRRLESSFEELLGRGLAEEQDPLRLTRMRGYDAFAWTLPPGIDGPMALFYDQHWHDLLARVTGVEATGDITGAVHHHRRGSKHGQVHRDLGVGWFPDADPTGAVNPANSAICSYKFGDVRADGVPVHEAVRAVTMIFYLCNLPWAQGDGGQTGLYRQASSPVESPAMGIPPLNNSLVVFENTPRAWHSFIANTKSPRNSVVLWLHRPFEQARLMFGESSLFRWPRPRPSAKPSSS